MVNGGFANGNNLGSKSAKGEYILFLNPDTVVIEAEIEKLLVLARSNPGYSLISCRQVTENGRESRATGDFPTILSLTGFQRSVMQLLKKKEGNSATAVNVTFPDWISGSVILISNKLFLQLEGFYEGFWMYYEDVDLCKRVAERGGKIAFARDITIEHNHGGSSRVNINTTSITKTEVKISLHLYVSRHLTGSQRILGQLFLVLNNIISGAVMALIGLLSSLFPRFL